MNLGGNMDQIGYIKNIIENEYGIIDEQSYIEYKKKCYTDGITAEEINKLSPDTIDSGSFWEYIEKHSVFNRDAIAYGVKNTQDPNYVNWLNYRVACSLGIFDYILMFYNVEGNLLDIGAGYGMIKNFIDTNTKLSYYGVDAYPKINGIYKVDDCILPDDILKLKYKLIIATNTFQHLSVRQRKEYYRQVAEVLEPNGVFSISNVISNQKHKDFGFRNKENDKMYLCHYGQYTELQTFQELMSDISQYFNIISETYRNRFEVTFHCVLK